MFSIRRRVHQRAVQRAALNRPDLSRHFETPDPEPRPAPPVRMDWPEVPNRQPHSWQVHRVELHDGVRTHVLIAQVRTEDEAFRVEAQQASQVCITKWGSKQPPYYSARPPKVIA